MPVTRIDCSFYRSSGQGSESSSYVALNPRRRPGSLVMAGSCAVRDSIGSQMASKLALQYFVEGVLACAEAEWQEAVDAGPENQDNAEPRHEASLKILEEAFKNANSSVYNFGHKLAAGGRMAASLLGLVIEDDVIAAGRVGEGSAYLARFGELYPFFEQREPQISEKLLDGFVGAHSMVSVELASVPIKETDVLLVFSEMLDALRERELASVLRSLDLWEGTSWRRPNPLDLGSRASLCAKLIGELFAQNVQVSFAMLAVLGPQTVFLK